jgi:hypothetical protein
MSADFLRDGIRKNPRDYRLYFDLGYAIYEQKLQDHPNAILYLDEARRHKHDKWVPRMLFRSLFLNGQYEDSIEGWTEYLKDFPGHEVGLRQIDINQGFLAEAIADEARECIMAGLKAKGEFEEQLASAQAGGDQSEITRLTQEIEKADTYMRRLDARITKELTYAMNLWTKLYEDERDTLAYGRIVRRQAINLRNEDRALEAIAELDLIRWLDFQFFDEASNLIIDIKQDHAIPLSVSEQLQLLRQEDAKKWLDEEELPKRIRRLECEYMTDEEFQASVF